MPSFAYHRKAYQSACVSPERHAWAAYLIGDVLLGAVAGREYCWQKGEEGKNGQKDRRDPWDHDDDVRSGSHAAEMRRRGGA